MKAESSQEYEEQHPNSKLHECIGKNQMLLFAIDWCSCNVIEPATYARTARVELEDDSNMAG